MRPRVFDATNWYWVIANSSSQVYSSAVGDYVSISDPTYQAWLTAGHSPTNIDTEANLADVLAPTNALRPVAATLLSLWQASRANLANTGPLPVVLFKILFNHENRIRTLEAKPTITAQQFLNGISALL